MALVPGGDIYLAGDTAVATHSGFEFATTDSEPIPVESVLLDRRCVTNADYARFVQSDGYTNAQLWPEDVLPSVLQFVDATGHPGPSGWSDGKPPAGKLDHPVVGICWYEASAYAAWAGKRLPTTTEWQRAGTWPKVQRGIGCELRYPWGNAFDPDKANTWSAGRGGTRPARDGVDGETPNGVRQLIGNVWEWVDAQFYPAAERGVSVLLDQAMAEIRGGAFDTYFTSHTTCQFSHRTIRFVSRGKRRISLLYRLLPNCPRVTVRPFLILPTLIRNQQTNDRHIHSVNDRLSSNLVRVRML